MLVDPLGVVECGLGEAAGVAVGEVTKERLASVRARLPLVEQRRAAARELAAKS
jgi:predicted amidohydrolase